MGLKKIVSTHTLLLNMFVVMFMFIFRKQKPLDELIEANMIADPLRTDDPLVLFYIANQSIILFSLIGVPVVALLLVKTYNRIQIKR